MAKMTITIELDDVSQQSSIKVDAEDNCTMPIEEFIKYSCQPIIQYAISRHKGNLCPCIGDAYSRAFTAVSAMHTKQQQSHNHALLLRQQKYN